MNFALQDYNQALEIDPNDQSIKSRISVIHNEFGINAYQEKNYTVSTIHLLITIGREELHLIKFITLPSWRET